MELLLVIVTLCQVSPAGSKYYGVSPKEIEKYQLSCQKYYINCVGNHPPIIDSWDVLTTCINNRPGGI